MDQDEAVLKQQYINEQIIEKGYNPEDLSNFVSRRRGVKLDDLPFNAFKKSIEQFKNERLNLTYNVSKQKKEEETKEKENQAKAKAQLEKEKEKEKESSLFDQLYSPVTYEVECKAQEDNPLKSLEAKNTKIHITVSEPKKIEATGFFKSPTYSFLITCNEINSSIRRSFGDCEWLYERLVAQYTYRYIPPLLKYVNIFDNSNEESLNMRVRYLNKFFEGICNKRLLRTSLTLYTFLTLPEDKFLKLKSRKEPANVLDKQLTSFINYSGKIKFELTREKIIYVNSLERLISPSESLLDKVNTTYAKLVEDLSKVSNHLQELSDLYSKLKDETRRFKSKDNLKNVYESFSNSLKEIGLNVNEQKNFISNYVKEHFNYLRMEYGQIINLTEHFDAQRNLYENFCKKLKAKKEQLFVSKNVAKWDLDPDDAEIENVAELINNKKLAIDKMCHKENIERDFMKKKLVLITHKLHKAILKLNKSQGEQIETFVKEMKNKYSDLINKEFNISKLMANAM